MLSEDSEVIEFLLDVVFAPVDIIVSYFVKDFQNSVQGITNWRTKKKVGSWGIEANVGGVEKGAGEKEICWLKLLL